MREKEIREALSALDEIKNLLRKETELGLRGAKAEFLIWGLYQLIASLFVYFTKDFRYFYFLLPFFFLLDSFKWTRWIALIYWLLAFGVYTLLLTSRFTYYSFGLIFLIMIMGLFFNMKKATKNTRFAFMPALWGYILFFGVILTFASIKSKTPELLYLLWPGIIAFAIGLWGLFSERFLFLFSLLSNLAGFIAFMFLKAHAIALTLTVYGIFYIGFYVYLNLKLKTG
ncbi:MAG: hypothetical protein QMD82_05695 [bacterium]|nr:hypothetical protein [bacterium]